MHDVLRQRLLRAGGRHVREQHGQSHAALADCVVGRDDALVGWRVVGERRFDFVVCHGRSVNSSNQR